MSKVVIPEDQQLLMAGYVLGDLSLEESQLLEQLLAENPYLRTDLAALQQSLEVTYGAAVSPPAHLKSAVMVAVNAVPEGEDNRIFVSQAADRPSHSSPRSFGINRRSKQWILGGLGIAAAMVAAALGLQNYTLRQALQARQSTPTAQSETEPLTFMLKAEQDSRSGEVALIVNPSESSAKLVAQGLPPLAEGKVYVLWTVVRDGVPVTTDRKNAILTAVFTVDEAGRQSEQITVPGVYRDRSLLTAIAVTIEDAAAPQAHQSDPILIQRL